MRWRLLLVIFAGFFLSMALFQFVWAAHEVTLGGEHALDGAANEANALRTAIASLVLLSLIGLSSTRPARTLAYAIRERAYQLW